MSSSLFCVRVCVALQVTVQCVTVDFCIYRHWSFSSPTLLFNYPCLLIPPQHILNSGHCPALSCTRLPPLMNHRSSACSPREASGSLVHDNTAVAVRSEKNSKFSLMYLNSLINAIQCTILGIIIVLFWPCDIISLYRLILE